MRILLFLFGTLFLGAMLSGTVSAEERATKEECIAMTKAASVMLEADKAAGIKEIGNPKGKFVWKDSYVFLMDKSGKMLAHPFKPELLKKDTLLGETDKNHVKPKKIFVEFLDVAFNNGEGWVDYKWPKPNSTVPSNKFTFIHRVGWTDMFVGAGTYSK
jgi:signal transduction histidine kinase